MAGQNSYAVEIPRAGQHPYMPGAVRLSTIGLILLWWLVGGLCVTQFIDHTARNVMSALVILCLGTGGLWYAGYFMAAKNPFHQEVVLRSVLRTLRGRTNLET